MSPSIKGFLETSFVDWPGKIASVVFLPHCNFRCPYCHNHELVLTPHRFATIPLSYILTRINKSRGWIDGVCITGGEPTLHSDLIRLVECFKKEQLLVKLDTNGSHPEVLEELLSKGMIDYVAMDVKAPLDSESYARGSGVIVELEKITRSIQLLQGKRVPYEFRITVVPTLHQREDIFLLAQELKSSGKLTLQNFNPAHTLDRSLRTVEPYPSRELDEMQEEVDLILQGETKIDAVTSLPCCA